MSVKATLLGLLTKVATRFPILKSSPPMRSSHSRGSPPLALVSLLAAMRQSPVNTGLERTVVVEYPSLETATAAYGSPAYAEALKALGDHAVRDFRIVEGIE